MPCLIAFYLCNTRILNGRMASNRLRWVLVAVIAFVLVYVLVNLIVFYQEGLAGIKPMFVGVQKTVGFVINP